MRQFEIDVCCETGVKGSCVTCNNSSYCNSRWSLGVGQATGAREVEEKTLDLTARYFPSFQEK